MASKIAYYRLWTFNGLTACLARSDEAVLLTEGIMAPADLITREDAQQLLAMPKRAFYALLRQHALTIYKQETDARVYFSRREVERLALKLRRSLS